MPIEPIPDPDNFLPSDMNDDFPEGTDSYTFGDDHIRLVKLALKNLERIKGKDIARLLHAFDDKGRVKLAVRALEADKLSSDVDLSKYALKDGDYEELRARNTNKYDVGLHLLLNMAMSRGFDPDGMSSSEYLSLNSLLAFQHEVNSQIDSKLSGDVDKAGLAEKDGNYPDLRAQATTRDDVDLGNFFATWIATKQWAEDNGRISTDANALVTPAYVKHALGLLQVDPVQSFYDLADNWSGTDIHFNNGDVARYKVIRTLTGQNPDNIDIKNEYWMMIPHFDIQLIDTPQEEVRFLMNVGSSVVLEGYAYPDGRIEYYPKATGRLVRRDFFQKKQTLEVSVSWYSFKPCRVRVKYKSGYAGIWSFQNNRNVGAS